MASLDIVKFKLKQALQNNSAKRVKLATSGKISPSRLAHYQTSKLLYTQPIPDTGKEYKCDIIIDVSGSMHKEINWGADRIWPAIESAQNLVKLFHWIVDFRILVFANGYRQISSNYLLSLRREDLMDVYEFIKHLSCPMRVVVSSEGKRNLIPAEWWEHKFYVWTWVPAVLKASIDSLSSVKWEWFIILISDWDDRMDEFWWCATGEELSAYVDEVWWVDVLKYCPERYPELIKEAEDAGVNILPIGIDISLDNFKDYVRISDASDVYEEVITFIDTKFNK